MPEEYDKTKFMKNAKGHLVPLDQISKLDKYRDDTVKNVINCALVLQARMRQQKGEMEKQINQFIRAAFDQYDAKIGGKKGNITLTSYDGAHKVQIAVSETLTFDERLQVAKQLVDECIHEWTKESDSKVQALIEHAFQTDKEGNINTGRVFGLFALTIEDDKWLKAMSALKDSISVASSKSYIRLYEREGDDGKYKQIPLDISAL